MEACFCHRMKNKKGNCDFLSHNSAFIFSELALCPAALLHELQPAPCFLSAIIGQID